MQLRCICLLGVIAIVLGGCSVGREMPVATPEFATRRESEQEERRKILQRIDELGRQMTSAQLKAEKERSLRFELEAELKEMRRSLQLVMVDNRDLTRQLDGAQAELDRLRASTPIAGKSILARPARSR